MFRICGVLAGLLIALPGGIEGFTGETAVTSMLIALSPALAFPALVGLWTTHVRGRFGLIAFCANLIGLGLFGGAAFTLNIALFFNAAEPAAPTRLALLGTAVVFAAGSVLFGIALIRSATAPKPPAWAYPAALPAFALLAPLPDSPLTSALHVVVGGTLVWLSTTVRDPVTA
ncbi:hypothetical protein ACFQV2_40100 [Actinokineospora soli]|uniref:Uncharacterized protein n=1 Tax=Actinokineospora soli TaxID=1048753 RepID=A0ABW2TF78_9PSEU